jgi:hypothetical protein
VSEQNTDVNSAGSFFLHQSLVQPACYALPACVQPGKKGISLSEDQWAKLLAGLPGLAAALDQT